MTLDEFIQYFRYTTANSFTYSECHQIADYLEELKTLRVKLEESSKELEVYKKAYDSLSKAYCYKGECWLKCECFEQCKNTLKTGVDITKELFLQKVREE